MNWKRTFAIVRREYVERIRTKAFWIASLLIPFLFLGYILFQISASRRTGGERHLVVVDRTGVLYAPLEKELARAETERTAKGSASRSSLWVLQPGPATGDLDAVKEALRKDVLAEKINGYLILDPGRLEKDEVEYYSTTVSDFIALSQLERSINRIRMRQKMQAQGLPAELATDLEKRVDFKAFKITEKGASEEKGAGIIAAIIFMVLMYTTFFVYGAQVMRGVLDEKTNRIVEVIIASVRPTELMLGKILGIGLVGLTQYFVWSVLAMNVSWIATVFSPGELGVPKVPVAMLGYFILFFILGYFVYASVYTTIAAPFNTEQEATQFVMIPIMLILAGFMVYPAVMNNPNGGVSVFFSLFPFTASLVMFLRTAVAEPPAWQILLSIGILIVTTIGLAWFAGRVYRVGILMYGKKPTIPEILRWVRYSPGKAPQPAIRPS